MPVIVLGTSHIALIAKYFRLSAFLALAGIALSRPFVVGGTV